jgi:diguanylate cyclase (GGDEF)-like protein
VHEVNTGAAGFHPARWLRAWVRRTRAPQGVILPQPESPQHMRSALRLTAILAAFVVVATLSGLAIGYRSAQQSDDQLSTHQHTVLRNLIAEFSMPPGRRNEPDPRLIRLAKQVAGVTNLKFDRNADAGGRETQPVIDTTGRIVGFFTWEKAAPSTQAFKRMLPLVSFVAIALAGFSGLTLWRLRRARQELAQREIQASRAADEDKLTGLPNHAKILELLDLALAERADDELTTFALIEVDGMEDVTAHHGVLGSDEVIATVARRLKEALPPHALCGRIASDKFAIALTARSDIDTEAIVRAALETVAHPHWIDNVVRVSAHAGFAQAPSDATTRGELTRRAELALRTAAKKGHGTIVAFDHSIDTVSADLKFIHRELPRAISAHELELNYQPIVSSHGGRMVGVEALLRWTHPSRGIIPPATFIPIAEQMGLMDTIGAFVLRRTLQEAKRWPEDLYVAVNLSPLQVRDATIVDMVRAALTESAVTPSRLVLEITEGVLIDNPDEMVKRIKDLHALGVRVALDDFGSGYSNLGYLQRFPLDKLKIDKSFVAALGRSSNGGVIIQAIVALGRALGLSVLVEGVETEHQRVLLRLAGCDEMQGFLFAKPAPADAIDMLLEQAAKHGKGRAAAGEALTA